MKDNTKSFFRTHTHFLALLAAFLGGMGFAASSLVVGALLIVVALVLDFLYFRLS